MTEYELFSVVPNAFPGINVCYQHLFEMLQEYAFGILFTRRDPSETVGAISDSHEALRTSKNPQAITTLFQDLLNNPMILSIVSKHVVELATEVEDGLTERNIYDRLELLTHSFNEIETSGTPDWSDLLPPNT